MKKLVISFLSIVLTASFAFSQSFSTSGVEHAEVIIPEGQHKSPASSHTITHSLDQSIVSPNSVACHSGSHTDNSYFRVFDLAAFGFAQAIDITSIDFGIESAIGATGSQPATINIYTLTGPLTWANLTLVTSQPISVADQALNILNVPIMATIPAGSVLVVEFFTPNGQADGNILFIGSNPLGETGPTYLAAADCGIFEPLTTAVIGFPDMAFVMNVNFETGSQVPISNWAIILGVLMIGTFIVIRYRRERLA